MDDFTFYLIWAVSTWFLANIIIGMLDAVKGDTKEFEDKIRKHLDNIVHRVREEKITDDHILWYDDDDNEFLAQGRNHEEIIERLKQRFPKHIFYLPSEHFIAEGTGWEPRKGTDRISS